MNVMKWLTLLLFFFFDYTTRPSVIHVVLTVLKCFERELRARYRPSAWSPAIVLHSWSSSKQTRVLTTPILLWCECQPAEPVAIAGGRVERADRNRRQCIIPRTLRGRADIMPMWSVRAPRPIFRRTRPPEKRPRRLWISSRTAREA